MFWGLNFHCFPVLDGHQPNKGLASKGGMARMSPEPGAGLFDLLPIPGRWFTYETSMETRQHVY